MASLTPTPDNEIERLKALKSYNILDTLNEKEFDRLTELASVICGVPIALVSLIDSDRQWFKSRVGLDAPQTPRDISFCQFAIMGDSIFEINDATADDRFKNNPLVTGAPDIRFYAGYPLIDDNGFALGTLCVIDRAPKKLNPEQQRALTILGQEVVSQIIARKERQDLYDYKQLFYSSVDLVCVTGTDGYFKRVNPAFSMVLGWSEKELLEKPFVDFVHPEDVEKTIEEVKKLSNGSKTINFVNRYIKKSGEYTVLNWLANPDESTGSIYAIARDITERKREENELISALNQTKQLQKALDESAIVSIVDDNFKITYVNDKFCEISKYSREELIGKDHVIVSSGYYSNEFLTNLKSNINSGNIWKGQIKNKNKNGSFYWVDTTIVPFMNGSDKPYQYIGISYDITEQVFSEQKIRGLAEFQNAILNGTDYAIIATDIEGIIVNFNKGAEELLGYNAEELIHKSSPAIFHDLDEVVARAKVLSTELNKTIEPGFEVFVAKSKTGAPDVNDWTYIKKDGIRIKVQLSVTTLFDSDKNITGYLGIARDVTEFLESQNKLKLSEEKHRVFFENAQGLMCTHDETGKFLSMNKAGAALIGYTPEELLQKTLYDVTPINLKKRIDNYLEKIYNKGAAEGLMSVLHKNGDAKVWYYKNILVDDSTDKRIAIGNAIDITERVKMEDELKKAKLQAEKSVFAKDQFLANMSHEIRTPMNAILGFADILKTTNLNNDQTEYLSAISNSGENLMVIINDILDFSKIDSGKLTLEHQPISIIKITNNIKKLLIHKANERNLAFNFYIENDLPEWVMGDSVRLNQILVNLLGNAIKFTEKGKVELYCNVLNKSDNNCIVQFIVKDTGIGIPKDKYDLVFERFKQADDNTTRKFGGTGLGLSITKKLLELFNGKIEIKSEEGVGSEFIVSIPFEVTEAKDKLELEKIERNSESKNYKVLLTEDNDLNQKLAKHILEKNNMVVEIAANGQIAVDMLKNNKYDVILMDLQMPVMDGYVATSFIRNVLKITTPMIAMTAHSLVGEKEKCIQTGMNEYISKPYKAKELIDKIKLLCSGEEVILSEVSIPKTLTVKADYDLSDINELSGGDAEFVKEMIKIFLTGIPEDLKKLTTAVQEGNISESRKVAHKIKASYALFMIQPLVELCDKIENGNDMKMIEEYSQIVTDSTNTILPSLAKELQ